MGDLKGKVLVSPSSFGKLDPAPLEALSGTGLEVVNNPYGRRLTKGEVIGLLVEVCGIVAGLEPLDEDVMTKSDLKVISRCGSGMSNVDQDAAARLGIEVYSTPYGPTEAVAELTLGALLGLLRHVPRMDRSLHEGKWDKRIGVQLQGKTVTIIGYGRIGRRVAEVMQPFDVSILVVDPFLDGQDVEHPVMALEEALPQADIVSLHLSGEEQVLGEKEFAAMKEGVYLLNGARGGLVDEECLVKNLESGKVAGAWIDAFGVEPYEGPLTGFDQVVLTPHIGSYALECRRSMEMESAMNLINALRRLQQAGDSPA
ncbi:NAD(P)-dependent oxidoreductase [Verrucomicrobiota bacterium]